MNNETSKLIESKVKQHRDLILAFRQQEALGLLFKDPSKVLKLKCFFEVTDFENKNNIVNLAIDYNTIFSEILPELKKNGHKFHGVFLQIRDCLKMIESAI